MKKEMSIKVTHKTKGGCMRQINNLLRKMIMKLISLPEDDVSESDINEWIFLTNIFDLIRTKKNFSNECSDRD